MLHLFPQNQIHWFLHSLTHSCTTSFLSTCLVSNTLTGSRGAKMNILKVGTLNGLETQEIRVTFLNQRYLAFHLGSCSFANVRTQHLPLNFPRTTTTHAHLSASPLAMPCYWHFLQDFFVWRVAYGHLFVRHTLSQLHPPLHPAWLIWWSQSSYE